MSEETCRGKRRAPVGSNNSGGGAGGNLQGRKAGGKKRT